MPAEYCPSKTVPPIQNCSALCPNGGCSLPPTLPPPSHAQDIIANCHDDPSPIVKVIKEPQTVGQNGALQWTQCQFSRRSILPHHRMFKSPNGASLQGQHPLPVLRHRVARYQNDPSLFWKLFKASKIWVQMVASKKPPPPRGGLPIVKTIDLPFSHTKWSEFTLRWRNALEQILINFLLLMISLICWSKWLSISSQFLNFECCCVCLPSIAWWEHFTCSLISKLIGWQVTAKTDLLHWISNWECCGLRLYHQKENQPNIIKNVYCTEFPKELRKQAIKPHKSQSLGFGFLWGKYVAS